MADRIKRGEPLRDADRQFFLVPAHAPATGTVAATLPSDEQLNRVVAGVATAPVPRPSVTSPGRLYELEREFRSVLFADALERNDGNRAGAARDLGPYFGTLLRAHGFEPPADRQPPASRGCGPCARSKSGRCVNHGGGRDLAPATAGRR
jgi:hypothetical protein